MMRAVFLCLLLLLSSCASDISVNPKNCSKGSRWLEENAIVDDFTDQKVFDETFLIAAGTGEKRIYLRDLLLERNIDCNKITSVMMTVQSNWIDTVLSIIPLVVFKKLRFRGTYIADPEPEDDENENENSDEQDDSEE